MAENPFARASLAGAVDLSALKARAEAPQGASHSGGATQGSGAGHSAGAGASGQIAVAAW
jgi:ribosomal protein L15